jgi:putative transposase
MVERHGGEVSVRRQCVLLDMARSRVYRVKAAAPPDDLALMRRIDELHLDLPFYVLWLQAHDVRAQRRGLGRQERSTVSEHRSAFAFCAALQIDK